MATSTRRRDLGGGSPRRCWRQGAETGNRAGASGPTRSPSNWERSLSATRSRPSARRGRIDVGDTAGRDEGAAGLTPRELEVLRLVAEGRSNQQIADALSISRKSASVHVSHILSKLGASTRAKTRVEAAAFAHRVGLDETAHAE